MARMQWWVLTFLAAVVLMASAGAFLLTQRPQASAPVIPAPRVRCPNLDVAVPKLLPDAEATPVLLWGVGKVRLFIDGKPAFSPPDAPLSFAPGEHRVRAEAEGAEPLALSFRLDAFRPAFFHFELDAQAGLTVAWLGAACSACAPALDKVELDFTRTGEADASLLSAAAAALRAGDWRAGSSRLRGVTPASRGKALFLRLASNVYQSTAQTPRALAALQKVPPAEAKDLDAVLAAHQRLTVSETARAKSLGLLRWNLLTEKFSGLLEKFAPEAPGPVQLATARLSELTAGFLEASQKGDLPGEDKTVRAGEEALSQFVRALRRSRPEDCAFQARISASL